MLLLSLFALPTALLIAAPSLPTSTERYDLEPDQLLLTYEAAFGKHQVSGVSRALEWSATTLLDGSAQVRLRVPVASFESGHARLDEELRRVIDANQYPIIEVEGTAKAGSLPIRFEGTVTFHGVTRPLVASLSLTRMGARVAVRTSFTIDLKAFDVAPPAIDATPVEDRIAVEFIARLRVHPRSVVSGGVLNSARAANFR